MENAILGEYAPSNTYRPEILSMHKKSYSTAAFNLQPSPYENAITTGTPRTRPITSEDTLKNIPKLKYLSLFADYKTEAKNAVPDEFDRLLTGSKKLSAGSTMLSSPVGSYSARHISTPFSLVPADDPVAMYYDFKKLFSYYTPNE